MGQGLRFKPKISLKQAVNKITVFAVIGEHITEPRPRSGPETAQFFANRGIDPDALAEELRDWRQSVPCFENLIPTGWSIIGNAKVTPVARDTRAPIGDTVEGPGKFIESTYKSLFATACRARDRAVEEDSYAEYLVAVVQGLASLEAFVNECALFWNSTRSADQQLADSKQHKVSFDEKVRDWIPIMTGGALDRGHRRWGIVKELTKLRDDRNIHAKAVGHGVAYKEFARQVNMLRDGIADTHFELHKLFDRHVPPVVIKAKYMPDVEVIGS